MISFRYYLIASKTIAHVFINHMKYNKFGYTISFPDGPKEGLPNSQLVYIY